MIDKEIQKLAKGVEERREATMRFWMQAPQVQAIFNRYREETLRLHKKAEGLADGGEQGTAKP